MESHEHLRRERDLFLQLLELDQHDDVTPFLRSAAGMVQATSDATRGYLEIRDLRAIDAPVFWYASGFSETELRAVRAQMSTNIIRKALASGEVVETKCAADDEDFSDFASVQANDIRAVLCAPIGPAPAMGVLYLQKSMDEGTFSEADQHRVSAFARLIVPAVERLYARRRVTEGPDPTSSLREVLRHPRHLIGHSPPFTAMLTDLCAAVNDDRTVLLVGPTGTGKTHIARILHDAGSRSHRPFAALNCAAIPDSLFESELFGTRRGAFTGAEDRAGQVRHAEGGTLFLDEISKLSRHGQAKLLTFIESKVYTNVGDVASRHADVRIVCATNSDPEEAMAAGELLPDFFYRIAGTQVRIPSLRERREDLAPLAVYFCAQTCARKGLDGAIRLTSDALHAIRMHPWPGNLREMSNVIENGVHRAVVEKSSMVDVRHLFAMARTPGGPDELSWEKATEAFQRQFLADTMATVQGDANAAARRLGLSRGYVFKLLKRFPVRKQRGL